MTERCCSFRRLIALVFGVFVLIPAAAAQCPEPDPSATLARAWRDKQPFSGLPPALSIKAAACVRERLVGALRVSLGPVAGYKVALSNPALQKKFGASGPLRGTLLTRMLVVESAMPVAVKFGARPVVEADLLVEVGDESINDARTPLQALRGLSRVMPFIELADLVVAEGEPLNAAVITAINAGARGGVFGQGILVEPTQRFADALRDMRVITTDEKGNELANADGAAILGHPLNAVLWLVEDIRNSGGRLRVGDKLSLGAYSMPIAPYSEMRLNVRYVGLPGEPQINVRFK
ncbi:MAG: hypothetical protein FJY56_00835 [Betaproteobacteria bacterium]|nr:hypothetical protein [Betaproteobacteria bacterium]